MFVIIVITLLGSLFVYNNINSITTRVSKLLLLLIASISYNGKGYLCHIFIDIHYQKISLF